MWSTPTGQYGKNGCILKGCCAFQPYCFDKNGIVLKSCGAPAIVNFEKSWHDFEMLWCTSTDQF